MRTLLTLSILAFAVQADAADIKSGLEPGAHPAAFNVQDITGPSAGTRLCYRCQYGSRPVVNIWARKIDANVAKLIKELDKSAEANGEMKSFVVMLTDKPESMEGQLKKLAKDQGISKTPLTVFDNSVGPRSYKIAKEADVTVLMWVDGEVKVNHAMKSADVNTAAIAKVVADTKKILN